MTILEALRRLRDDLKTWCINNFNMKLNKNLGAENGNKFLITDNNGEVTATDLTYAASESVGGVANSAYTTTPVTTSGDGANYTATVSGITALVAGVSFVMIPHTVSTATAPKLNVNNLGAKAIRRRVSNATTSTSTGYNASWLAAKKPIRVEYDGTFWIADLPKPSAADMSGTLGVANGGTGCTTIVDTTYTTARYRASALFSTDTDPSDNGVINWTYE